jgi:uncharacterized protein YjlB
MQAKASRGTPETFRFEDDGVIPNNPLLALVIFRSAIDLKGSADPETVIEQVFERHRWEGRWRNGIYPYVHYHSSIHEAMGIARGRAKVRFGGERGAEVDLRAGDVAVLPAGTGHQCLWASPDLVVIGAYPPTGKYDLCRGSRAEHAKAIVAIPQVPLPPTDPVKGKNGPLIKLWTASVRTAGQTLSPDAPDAA